MKNFFLLIIFLILSIGNNKYIFSQIDLPSETELLEIYSNEDALKEHQELNFMTAEAVDYVNKQNLLIFKISSSFRELLISESEDEIRSLFLSLKNYLNEINLNIDTLDSRISKIKSNSEVNLISWRTYYRYYYNIIIDIVDHNKDLADINKRYINNVFEFFEYDYEDERFNNLIIKLDKLTSENRFLQAKFLEIQSKSQRFKSRMGNADAPANIFNSCEAKYMLIASKLSTANAAYLSADINNIPMVIEYSNQAKQLRNKYLLDKEEAYKRLEKSKSKSIKKLNDIKDIKKKQAREEIINRIYNFTYQAIYYQNELLKAEIKLADFFLDYASTIDNFPPREKSNVLKNINSQILLLMPEYKRFIDLMNAENVNYQNFLNNNP